MPIRVAIYVVTTNNMERIAFPFRVAAWFPPAILIAALSAAPCFAQAPVTNSLVAHWSADGNAKDSAGHHDGTVSSALHYGPGPASAQAFYFGGGDSKNLYGVEAQRPPVTFTSNANGQVVYQFVEPQENNRGGGRLPQSGDGNAKVDFGSDIGNFGTRDFTIAFWMKTDSKYAPEALLAERAARWEWRLLGNSNRQPGHEAGAARLPDHAVF